MAQLFACLMAEVVIQMDNRQYQHEDGAIKLETTDEMEYSKAPGIFSIFKVFE